MKSRFPAAFLTALAAGLLACSVAGAAMIGIYRNSMESLAQRSQLVKLAGANCARAGANGAMRITLGEKTAACSFGTPENLQRKAYLGVELRAGAGAKYQLLVFPRQRKAQLVKVTEGGSKYLAIAKSEQAIKGINEANVLRLRAVNVSSGPEKGQARLFAYVGKTLVGEAVDAGAGELTGRNSAVTVGTIKNGNGVVASVDDIVVRVPSHF